MVHSLKLSPQRWSSEEFEKLKQVNIVTYLSSRKVSLIFNLFHVLFNCVCCRYESA